MKNNNTYQQLNAKVQQNKEIIITSINLAKKAIDIEDDNCNDIIKKIIEGKAISNEKKQFCKYIDSQSDDILCLMYAIYLCGQDIRLGRIFFRDQDEKQIILSCLGDFLEINFTREGIIDKFISVRLNLFIDYMSSTLKSMKIDV